MERHYYSDLLESSFKQYYASLHRYALRVTADEDDAHDVVSEVFVALWNAERPLDIKSVKPYLFSATRHKALELLRKRKRLSDFPIYSWDSMPLFVPSPLEKLVSKQSAAIVKQLLDSLSPLRKEMIELRLHGLSNREIAEIMDIAETKVEYNMRESIEYLRATVRTLSIDPKTMAEGLALVNIILMIV